MRMFWGKGAMALALCSFLLLAGASFAATTVTVKVLERGAPVQGVAVQVMASDGATSMVTDQSGVVTTQLNGTYFRLKVNGVVLTGLHNVNEGTVTVELN